MKSQDKGKIRVILTAVVVGLIMLFFVPAYLFPKQTASVCSAVSSYICHNLAWLMFACYITLVAGAVYISFSKHGRVRMGGRDAKPQYTKFEYISMNMCSALAAGVVVFGFTEWMYYVTDTPFQIEPGSVKAFEYAAAYPLFHWGPAMWALYVLPGIAIGYLYYNRKCMHSWSIAEACLPALGKYGKAASPIIEGMAVFSTAAACCTTVGLGTPVIAQLYATIVGCEVTFGLKLAVISAFFVFLLIFGASPLKKGMARISKWNVWLGIAVLALILVIGPTSFILNTFWESVGTNISNFVDMSFFTDSIGQGLLSPDWTVFYIVWYLGIAAKTGIWVAKISYGRTFKEIMWAVCIWTSIACWASFSILGNYAMHIELTGGTQYSALIGTMGQSGVIADIVGHLPAPKVFMAAFICLVFLNIATSATSSANTTALMTSRNLGATEEPSFIFKLFWIVMVFAIPVAFLLIENATGIAALTIIKKFNSLMYLPLITLAFLVCISFVKIYREDLKNGAVDFELDVSVEKAIKHRKVIQ